MHQPIKQAKVRHALADSVIAVIEALRDDYLPGEPICDAFMKIVLVHAIFVLYQSGRASSVAYLSRRTGVPRMTVTRRLQQLTRQGIIKRQGNRYVPSLAAFDGPARLSGFDRRRAMLQRAMSEQAH